MNQEGREILSEKNIKPIYRFEKSRPDGSRETLSDDGKENTFSNVLRENVADLYDRFTEVNVSSFNPEYENTFNTLFRNVDGESESEAHRREMSEIQGILKNLTQKNKNISQQDVHALHQIAKPLSEEERMKTFRNFLRGLFDREHHAITKNVEYNTQQSVVFLNVQVDELYQAGFSDLQNIPYFKTSVLDRIQDLDKKGKELVEFSKTLAFDTLQEESKKLAGTEIEQCFEEEKEKAMRKMWKDYCEDEAKKIFGDGLESRKASFSDEQNALCEFLPEDIRNMMWQQVQQNFSAADKQTAFKHAVRNATTQKRTLFTQKIENFQTQFNVLQGQIQDLQEKLEEYANLPENKIAEEIYQRLEKVEKKAEKDGTEKLLPGIQNVEQLIPRVRHYLSGVTDPLERAVKVAEIVNNTDMLKNSGWDELSPDEQAKFLEEGAAMEKRIAEQPDEEKKSEKITPTFLKGKIADTLKNINSIQKTYLTDDLGVEYTNGEKQDKKYVDDDVKAICNEILRVHRDNLAQYEYDLENVDPERKDDLDTLNSSINLTNAELTSLEKKILNAVEARVKPVLTIKFVSPIAIYKGIEAIIKHIAHEYEHDDEVNATHVQEHVAGALSGVPGRLGRYAKQAQKKAVSQRESHDADERKSYDYSNFSNSGILDVFNNWSDGETQHLRTLMEQLAERGLIRWDSRVVWEHLQTVSGIAMPEEAVDDFAKRDEILAKMVALGFGDDDWYTTFRDKNASSAESKYKARSTEAKELVDKRASDKAFEQILSAHFQASKDSADGKIENIELNQFGQMDIKKGKTFDYATKAVDTELYKALIVGAIDSVGMTAEDMIFYLIRGVATGLLSREFLTHLEEKNFYNSWPILNYFRKISMDEILQMDEFLIGVNPGGPNAGENVFEWTKDKQQRYLFDGDNSRVQKLIHNYLAYRVGDRVEKVVKNWDGVDNDIQQESLYKLSASEMKNVLGKYSGKAVLKEAGIRNGYSGYSTFFSHLKVGQGDPNLDKKVNFAAGVLGNFVVLDGGLRGRSASQTDFDDTKYDSPGAMTNAGISPREYANIMKNFIRAFLGSLEPAFVKSVCKCDMNEAVDLLFNDDHKNTKLKDRQQKFVYAFASEYLPALIKNQEARKKLLFLTDLWNKQEAFPDYENANNSGVAKKPSLHSSLRFNQEAFEEWEATEWEKFGSSTRPEKQDLLLVEKK